MQTIVDTSTDGATGRDPDLIELTGLFREVCEKRKCDPTSNMIKAGVIELARCNPREDDPEITLELILRAMLDHA